MRTKKRPKNQKTATVSSPKKRHIRDPKMTAQIGIRPSLSLHMWGRAPILLAHQEAIITMKRQTRTMAKKRGHKNRAKKADTTAEDGSENDRKCIIFWSSSEFAAS